MNPNPVSPMKLSRPLGLALLAAVLAATSCSRPKPPAPTPPKVTVAPPRMMTVTNWDEYPGHLEAVESVELRARVSGYLESIHFVDGAEVKTGDLLFVIDPKPYQADLDRAQAQRRQAATHFELAQNDLKRAEELRGTKAISDEELDSRSNAAREAEAAVAAAQAAEAAVKLNLDYTRITAPISGKIGRRLVTLGNLVQGGSSPTVLATLVSQDPIYCYFDVEEATLARYRAYQVAAGTGDHPGAVRCEVALANESSFPHPGRLDFFDNQVNPQTGTIRLRAVFDNADRTLVPGMFANLRVMAGPPQETMLIPAVAIGSDQGYKYVFLVNRENLIENRPITTGRAYGEWRAVFKGLSVEDQVVVNGLMTVMMLRPGAKVEAQTAPAAPAPEKAGEATARPPVGH
jgi:RND family efflux transporter MFP subunit